jgi:hypothetical protein
MITVVNTHPMGNFFLCSSMFPPFFQHPSYGKRIAHDIAKGWLHTFSTPVLWETPTVDPQCRFQHPPYGKPYPITWFFAIVVSFINLLFQVSDFYRIYLDIYGDTNHALNPNMIPLPKVRALTGFIYQNNQKSCET